MSKLIHYVIYRYSEWRRDHIKKKLAKSIKLAAFNSSYFTFSYAIDQAYKRGRKLGYDEPTILAIILKHALTPRPPPRTGTMSATTEAQDHA